MHSYYVLLLVARKLYVQDEVALDHAAHARPEEPRRAVPNGVPVRACGPAGSGRFDRTDKCGLWQYGRRSRACKVPRGARVVCDLRARTPLCDDSVSAARGRKA